MLEHFCRVTMLGRATNDPVKRVLGRATVVAFGFVFNDRYKNGGTWHDKPMFMDCEAFDEVGEHVARYVRKGFMVLVEGKLRLDEWFDRDKVKHRKHKLILMSVQVVQRPAAKPELPAAQAAAPAEPTEPTDKLFADEPADDDGATEPEPI